MNKSQPYKSQSYNEQPKSHEQPKMQRKILFRSLVGNSKAMLAVRKDIEQVAPSDANVLILGESGTGKEVVARNVHYHSRRRNKAFVPVNCGAIPPDLLESELFGHEKGAFTGAISARQGRFSMAEGGTLFLDEIGEMTMAMQVKLLRVLEERTFERVGGNTTIHADIRIVAATNRNLKEMVTQGKFREDLYFRLDVFPIRLPALRERITDLPLLVNELISRLEHNKGSSVRFSTDAIMALSQYNWPGNVRELANQIERMAIKHPCGLVQSQHLPEKFQCATQSVPQQLDVAAIDAIMQKPQAESTSFTTPSLNFPAEDFDLKAYMANIEVSIIQTALDKSHGVIAHAAKSLGMQRTTLAEKMRKYHISRPMESSAA